MIWVPPSKRMVIPAKPKNIPSHFIQPIRSLKKAVPMPTAKIGVRAFKIPAKELSILV